MISLEDYSAIYLEKSWLWLNEPEIKFLTQTPEFTKESQKSWFDNLGEMIDYKIWGVSYDRMPIGVFGIKKIDYNKRNGEYWGYIGEKKYWGMGIGTVVLKQLLIKAKDELKLEELYLRVIKENHRAINLYRKLGFKETGFEDGNLIMKVRFD